MHTHNDINREHNPVKFDTEHNEKYNSSVRFGVPYKNLDKFNKTYQQGG